MCCPNNLYATLVFKNKTPVQYVGSIHESTATLRLNTALRCNEMPFRVVGRGFTPAETNGVKYTAFGKIAH